MKKFEVKVLRVFGPAFLALCGGTASAQVSSSQVGRAQEMLGLLDAEIVSVDLLESEAGALLVPLHTGSFADLLVLRPHIVRAPEYRVLVPRADGSLSVSPSAGPRTFRGVLTGVPGSLVSASLADEGLFARILLPEGNSLWLEPLSGRLPRATADEYVLYEDEDVVETGRYCAVPVAGESSDSGGAGASGGVGASGGGDGDSSQGSSAFGTALKVAELACDADFEYFTTYGSVSAVESRIHVVVDAINLQYEAEVGITHLVTTILVRTSPTQPYTSTDPNTLLVQFRDEWNAQHSGIQRDVAHLFTGKQLDGSVIGIAYLGVICNSSYGYGLSQSDFSSSFAAVTDLTAHELGHNWDANHCSCTSYTMNPYITAANTFNPSATIPVIESFRDSLSCLDDGGGPPPEPPDPEINLSNGESTADGSTTAGSHFSTHDQDDVHEVIQEATTGGKPSKRKSMLSHTWTFDVQPGDQYTFFVDAHHSSNLEGDDFLFSYSRAGGPFVPMLTVTKTGDDDVLQSFVFAEDVSGTLAIRAEDTDHTAGNGTKDSLFVDQLYVHTELDGGDTTPPGAPSGLVGAPGNGSAALDWSDNTEADLAGYNVQRATSAAGPFSQVNVALLLASDWTDTSVVNGTTYHYRATAVDDSGNESAPSSSIMVTPTDGMGGPASQHVDSILVTAVNQGGGLKKGRADVSIVDDLGDPVADALVLGSFSGGLTETLLVSTDSQGQAVFITSDSKKGSLPLTFCVDDVTHASLNYASESNVETCDVK